jgi:Lrp/AsnC family leucine-responsive transcriptional regulator
MAGLQNSRLNEDHNMAEKLSDVDQFDRKILDILTVEGRISVTELARRIGLSKSPTQARLKRLEESGVIRGYRALYDPIRLGRDHVACVEVKLSDTREAALSAFNAAVMRVPEIEQCHLIAGAFDYLLKVRTAGMTGYRAVLAEKISTLPHVANTSTYVAMQAVKEEGLSPVAPATVV